MPRAFLIVLDSVGCGGAPDAADFGDAGANTLLHIAQACASGLAEEGRSGPLETPNLRAMGLSQAVELACGSALPGPIVEPQGLWGAATEVSMGKDTPSGHWEIAGRPVPFEWTYYPKTVPCFPEALSDKIAEIAGVAGILGNCHGSGTEMIEIYGAAHIETGQPIVYTSADSVVQIAAHEAHFGLERLLDLCAQIAPECHAARVGRVIARPFVGALGGAPGSFKRTANRKDFAHAPPDTLLCDWVHAAGRPTIAIGKISDIFSDNGIDKSHKGADSELFAALLTEVDHAPDGALIFANFVEFDSLYGHRRDVSGYARHLERFDRELGALLPKLRPDDLIIITADHGNDPTWHGTDHTRERVPVLALKAGQSGSIGQVAFSDIGASVAHYLGVPSQGPGRSFF
ncbi:MAG: phosphopentomutase [Pseudomonadota bacterium]